jgi:PIN domain nuclease of toxin-antitoxin system
VSVVVLDSSAYLTRLWGEDGSQVVEAYGGNYLIGSVNAAEIFTKIIERGPVDVARVKIRILATSMNIVPFDDRQSMTCAELRISTRHLGLSLGDRACLALAIRERATVITADRSWAGLDLGIEIKVIR